MNTPLTITTKNMKSKQVSDPGRKTFSNMGIKLRIFLANASYSRLNKKDVETRTFISNAIVMLAQVMNPFPPEKNLFRKIRNTFSFHGRNVYQTVLKSTSISKTCSVRLNLRFCPLALYYGCKKS